MTIPCLICDPSRPKPFSLALRYLAGSLESQVTSSVNSALSAATSAAGALAAAGAAISTVPPAQPAANVVLPVQEQRADTTPQPLMSLGLSSTTTMDVSSKLRGL